MAPLKLEARVNNREAGGANGGVGGGGGGGGGGGRGAGGYGKGGDGGPARGFDSNIAIIETEFLY